MSQCDRILALLADGKPHDHHSLYALGCVAHSRVAELRKRGYRIDQWREGDLYLYRLVERGGIREGGEAPTEAFSPSLGSVASASLSESELLSDAARVAEGCVVQKPSREGGVSEQLELVPDEPEQRGAYWAAA